MSWSWQSRIFNRMQIALPLLVTNFQLDLSNKDEFFSKFNFWIIASSTGFNDVALVDFWGRQFGPRLIVYSELLKTRTHYWTWDDTNICPSLSDMFLYCRLYPFTLFTYWKTEKLNSISSYSKAKRDKNLLKTIIFSLKSCRSATIGCTRKTTGFTKCCSWMETLCKHPSIFKIMDMESDLSEGFLTYILRGVPAMCSCVLEMWKLVWNWK